MPSLTVYGLASCDTCRKAIACLDAQQVSFHYHDVRKDGLDATDLRRWLRSPFSEKLLNRQSTTWRQLSDKEKSAAESDPLPLLLEHPTLLKRPVFVREGEVVAVGFKPETLQEALEAGAVSE